MIPFRSKLPPDYVRACLNETREDSWENIRALLSPTCCKAPNNTTNVQVFSFPRITFPRSTHGVLFVHDKPQASSMNGVNKKSFMIHSCHQCLPGGSEKRKHSNLLWRVAAQMFTAIFPRYRDNLIPLVPLCGIDNGSEST